MNVYRFFHALALTSLLLSSMACSLTARNKTNSPVNVVVPASATQASQAENTQVQPNSKMQWEGLKS